MNNFVIGIFFIANFYYLHYLCYGLNLDYQPIHRIVMNWINNILSFFGIVKETDPLYQFLAAKKKREWLPTHYYGNSKISDEENIKRHRIAKENEQTNFKNEYEDLKKWKKNIQICSSILIIFHLVFLCLYSSSTFNNSDKKQKSNISVPMK